ncbi:MAG: formylglycine-generating enzyme family protein [Planctomycetota bacterium]
MILRTTLVFSLCSVAAVAQTNRSVTLGTAPGLGVTSTYTAVYPTPAAGRFGFFLLTLPELTAQPLTVPGFTSSGLLRVDLNNQLLNSFWLLDGSGSQGFSVPIPTDYVFQGFSFDVQTVDVDFGASDIAWADNDLELTIGQGVVGQGLNLVRIPAGTFQMGSPVAPLGQPPYYNSSREQPVHAVTITLPFWMGKYEVTQVEYQAVMGTNPSFFVGPQLPVEQVSWNNAMAYCAALTAAEAAAGRVPGGYQYRLPTEAEWEYCYRAGTTTEYWFGPTIACGQAHFSYSYHSNSFCGGSGQSSTANVGSYPANPWGLHDVAGNVWEWCLDSWDGSANYPASAVSDPYVSSGPDRVLRGGSWNYISSSCRAAFRVYGSPGVAFRNFGFRVVLAPVLVP